MFRKIYLLSLSIIYLMVMQCAVIYAKENSNILTIASMQEIQKHIDKDTLVLLDLDHTVFEGKEYGYGHGNWFYDQVEEGKTLGYEPKAVVARLFPHWLHSQQNTQVKAVEAITPTVIKELQDKGIKVMGLTSRQLPLADITLKQLSSIGIDFEASSFPVVSIDKTFSSPTLMKKGVIFCSDYNDKGAVLQAYLQKMQVTPQKVVFVDDGLRNIESVIKSFAGKPVEVAGFYYQTVDEHKKHHWNKALAQQAYYSEYLDSSHLPPFFLEKKNHTVKQDLLVSENAAIQEPYEFEILGKTFIGLPGVFSPKVFGATGDFAKILPIKKDVKILEIGSATGYFATLAALNGAAKVVALDISEAAVKNTKLNAQRHHVAAKVDARQSDIFSAVKANEKFDLIYWDIPFNHTDKTQLSALEKTIYDPNHQLLTRFLKDSARYLKPKGVVYLAYSPTHGNVDYLYALAKHEEWEIKTIKQYGEENTIQIALYALTKKSA